MSTTAHEPQEAYDGPAVLVHHAGETAVTVTLRGLFQPLDGRFHWYGRVVRDGDDAHLRSGGEVRVRTPYGEAAGRLSDLDPWGRFRLSGTGAPPF